MKESTFQILWDTSKVILEREIYNGTHIIKDGKTQINHFSYHLKTLKKEEKNKAKAVRRKEIYIRSEMN